VKVDGLLGRVLRFSIERRALVVLLALGAGCLGLLSLKKLPIDAVPDITNKQVQINIEFPGLSPLEIEKQISFPIERALAGVPGLDYSRSISRNAFAQVTAVFKDEVDVYFARQQVAERLQAARDELPPGAQPVMGPISTGLGEVTMWSLSYTTSARDAKTYVTPEGEVLATEVERMAYLRTLQDWVVRPQLMGVEGMAGVDSIGGFEKQIHVQPDPTRLIAQGISFGDVIEALERNNVSTGAGYIERRGEAYVVRAEGRLSKPEDIARIVVGSRGGTPIQIRDLATVGVGKELRTGSASQNGAEVVIGTAMMRIGENSRTVAQAVVAKLDTIRKTLPPGVELRVVLNRMQLVDATIGTVAKNLAEGAILVIVVLFALLGNIRAALITAMAIPLSMLLTSIGMVESRISGNLMSLGAIDFGLVVDGAVIIVENCLRMLAEKQQKVGRVLTLRERLDVVFEASSQVRKATAFGEAIIITVYVPILALTGVEGKMFHPMALTVIFALAAAFVLSLTFVPAMVALVVRGRVTERENFLLAAAKRIYAPVVELSIRHRGAVVVVAVVAWAASLLVFGRLGQEFVPTLDEKNIAMHAMRIPSTGIEQSTAMQLGVERTVSAFPEVEVVFSKTGTAEMASDPMPPNVSDTFIILKPSEKWPDPSKPKLQLIQEIERALGAQPGHAYEFTQPIQMRFNELIAGVRGDVAVKVYGDDFAEMENTAQAVNRALAGIRGVADLKVEQTKGLPALNVEVDRDAIARLGLNVADIQDVVSVAVGGRGAGLIFEGDRRFEIVVRLPEELRRDIDALEAVPVPLKHAGESSEVSGSGGKPFVPLGSVARLDLSEGPNQISRENGKRRIVVQANVRGRDLGSFVAEAQQKVDQGVKLGAGQWLAWGGQFENLVAARERLTLVVPLCLFFIFLMLYTTFHSVKDALLVFTGVPLALTGGILALWIRGIPFSISAAVGFIALSGVAVLNGLVMVMFINQLRDEGLSVDEAIQRGALTRLRPVLMTALVASLGFVPMAIATGTGAEVQRPLATVVIGGLVSSTLLTLIILPALYRIFDRGARATPAVVET
jgi:cobalt-zinc-cadmium resistance protein CzcA